MRSVAHWQRRLEIAVREAEDAERVWRAASHSGGVRDDFGGDVLWQELQTARDRALQLELALAASHRRYGALARLRSRVGLPVQRRRLSRSQP
jgi:hypothetical protein